MTTDDLARLRSLAEAATPGPYLHRQTGIDYYDHRQGGQRDIASWRFVEDAALHTSLDPQTVLALLDAAEASERLREALDDALEIIDLWRQEADRIVATPPPATVDEEAVSDAAMEVFIDAMQEPSR